jgi:uronate dehydrogenase
VDLRLATDPVEPDEQAIEANLLDLAAAERAAEGVDAILHLAGNPRTSATWEEVRGANIEVTYNVFEAARRRGVGKVVFATTNHVLGFYNLEGAWPIGIEQPIRPDSYYGVSKAFGEALARFYSDAFGMSMICIRIGWFLPRPHVETARGLWISPRDMAQLVRLAVLTDRRFGIYNGTSNNSVGHWDLSNARVELGYAPQDDSNAFKDEIAPDTSPYVEPQAGARRAEQPAR